MQVAELFEGLKRYKAVFKLGRHKREQLFTSKTIENCKVLSHGDLRRIDKLDVGSTMKTQFEDEQGRTMVYVTRTE